MEISNVNVRNSIILVLKNFTHIIDKSDFEIKSRYVQNPEKRGEKCSIFRNLRAPLRNLPAILQGKLQEEEECFPS